MLTKTFFRASISSCYSLFARGISITPCRYYSDEGPEEKSPAGRSLSARAQHYDLATEEGRFRVVEASQRMLKLYQTEVGQRNIEAKRQAMYGTNLWTTEAAIAKKGVLAKALAARNVIHKWCTGTRRTEAQRKRFVLRRLLVGKEKREARYQTGQYDHRERCAARRAGMPVGEFIELLQSEGKYVTRNPIAVSTYPDVILNFDKDNDESWKTLFGVDDETRLASLARASARKKAMRIQKNMLLTEKRWKGTLEARELDELQKELRPLVGPQHSATMTKIANVVTSDGSR